MTKSHLVPHPTPTFFDLCNTFSSSDDWSRARSFAIVIDKTTVRSSFVTLLQTNKTVQLCDAFRVFRRRLFCGTSLSLRLACTQSSFSHDATCKRRVDAKASSDEAVIDVEVDRCIDENSASNHKQVAFLNASFTEASSRLHRDSSQISLPRTINVPVLQSHREAPCTD